MMPMPGYKSLPEEYSGVAAEQVRFAELLQRAGANEDAVHLLESALEVHAASVPELPGWLCGRLAAMYRTLKRHDDEVRLLVRFRDSQRSEEARSRFDARLSKARALAERKTRSENQMLTSVRSAVSRRSQQARTPVDLSDYGLGFEVDTLNALRDALCLPVTEHESGALEAALSRLSREAKERDYPPDRLVATLKGLWQTTLPPAVVDPTAWHTRYRVALTRSLALYFDEDESRE
jgi:hypothetical protein